MVELVRSLGNVRLGANPADKRVVGRPTRRYVRDHNSRRYGNSSRSRQKLLIVCGFKMISQSDYPCRSTSSVERLKISGLLVFQVGVPNTLFFWIPDE